MMCIWGFINTQKIQLRTMGQEFFWMMLFKSSIDYSYIFLLAPRYGIPFYLDFNIVKYIYGFMCLWITFLGIGKKRKASNSLLLFFWAVNLIPITVIYEMRNENTFYYSCICISFVLCEIIVRNMKDIDFHLYLKDISKEKNIIGLMLVSSFFFIVYIFIYNGAPTLLAMDFEKVYELRNSGIYQIGKYALYIQSLLMILINPILLAYFYIRRRYRLFIMVFVLNCVLYLYTGLKTIIFMGLFATVISVVAKNNNYYSFGKWFCLLFSAICLLAPHNKICESVHDILVRRSFLVHADLSFSYYDFFSNHPLVGVAGIFPRWIIPVHSPYENLSYAFQIGAIYHNDPTEEAANGFISEGFLRFGFAGMFLEFIIFALILKLVDGFATKTNDVFPIAFFTPLIYALSGEQLVGRLVGFVGVWILFMIIFRTNIPENNKGESSIEGETAR